MSERLVALGISIVEMEFEVMCAKSNLGVITVVMAVIATISFPIAPVAQTIIDGDACVQKNRAIRAALPNDNLLRESISRGAIGDGIDHPWRREMRRLKVKHAYAQLAFRYGLTGMELKLERLELSPHYYQFGKIVSPDKEFVGSELGVLKRTLSLVLFRESVSILINSSSKPETGCGIMHVNVLDEACLPAPYEMPQFSECSSPSVP